MADVQALVDRLMYDGVLLKHVHSRGGYGDEDDYTESEVVEGDMWMYQALPNVVLVNGWTESPCGKCPVFQFCAPGAEISPESCTYLTKWLEF